MRHRILAPFLALAVVSAGLTLTPAPALAQDETIDACVHNGSGVLYLKQDRGSTSDACTNRDEEIQWNQQGPEGPAGPAGPPGPPGISGYEIVQTECSAGALCSPGVAATCPAGKRVLGGGYDQSGVTPSSDSGTVNPSYAGPSQDGTQWKVEGPPSFFATHFPNSASIVVYAICAAVETAE